MCWVILPITAVLTICASIKMEKANKHESRIHRRPESKGKVWAARS
jgi:hypothetical protein